jgi:hypothetical protein
LIPIIGSILISVLGSVATKVGAMAWKGLTSKSTDAAAQPSAAGSFASVLQQETNRSAPAASPASAASPAPAARPVSLPTAVGSLANPQRVAAQAYARAAEEVQAP